MKDQGVFWKTIRRLAAQSAVPFLISVAYAAWVYINKGEKAHATDAISAFGASFFFLMWLVGQFFRTSKQLADSDSFSRLSAGIDDINKSIRELKEAPATGSAQTANAGTTPSNQLMFQAKQLVQNGHVLAGLLQAGVAFEQAVLAKAHRMGLDRQNFRSVPHLLAQIEDQLGPGARKELLPLWKLRNQIVHADPQASDELQKHPELVDHFDVGIKMLGPDRDAF